MKVLFLDESGDHNLAVIDPQYPLFVLGGVIVDQDYAEQELTRELQAFKLDLFGREDIVLHTADLARNRHGFERMKDTAFRTEFLDKLNALMRRLTYTVVACVVRKDEHLTRYGVAALDPYLLSLDLLVERFCFELGNVTGGGVEAAPELTRRICRLRLGRDSQRKGASARYAVTSPLKYLGMNIGFNQSADPQYQPELPRYLST